MLKGILLLSILHCFVYSTDEDPTLTFEAGLARAQAMGIAETDPSGDTEINGRSIGNQ